MNEHENDFRQALLNMLPTLRRYCFALTNHQHDADDLLQASVERALARWQQFETGTQFDRWMYRLCRNLWIDTMRKHKPTEEFQDDALLPDTLSNIENEAEQAQLLAKVQEKMTLLSEGLRMVLYLVAVEGRSYKETAEILDIPAGTVMSRLARARQQLTENSQYTGG